MKDFTEFINFYLRAAGSKTFLVVTWQLIIIGP